jgi:hypothetical protein
MSDLESPSSTPYDDFPPEEKVIEEVREALNRLLPGLSVEKTIFTVTLADGTEKSWEIKPIVEHGDLHTALGEYDE